MLWCQRCCRVDSALVPFLNCSANPQLGWDHHLDPQRVKLTPAQPPLCSVPQRHRAGGAITLGASS